MVPRLSAPIVLAHGLLGFDKLGFADVTLASYFRGIPEFLREAGNRVIQTAVPPTGSIAARAEALKRRIEIESPDEPVHIIAHSMGGLDARHMISRLGMAGRVLSLSTLGTPHRGSCFADWICDVAAKLGVFGLMRFSKVDDQAFHDLRVEACARFNAETPDAPGVRYLSVGGAPPRERLTLPHRFSSGIIEPIEGPNDGLVSLASARWGESFESWPCDHVHMIGWAGPLAAATGRAPDILPYYEGLLKKLAA